VLVAGAKGVVTKGTGLRLPLVQTAAGAGCTPATRASPAMAATRISIESFINVLPEYGRGGVAGTVF
jgi:hypothetical protein